MAISFISSAVAYITSNTAISITHGLTLADGDVLIALISNNNASGGQSMTSDSSYFTQHYLGKQGTVQAGAIVIFSRYITTASGEPSAYAWTQSSAVSATVHLFQFRGVHTDIWDVLPAVANITAGTTVGAGAITAPDITIIASGAMGLLMAAVVASAALLSSPTNGYGDLIVYAQGAGRCQGMARKAALPAGATGTSALTLNVADDYAICQCALKPAPAAWAGITVIRDVRA